MIHTPKEMEKMMADPLMKKSMMNMMHTMMKTMMKMEEMPMQKFNKPKSKMLVHS